MRVSRAVRQKEFLWIHPSRRLGNVAENTRTSKGWNFRSGKSYGFSKTSSRGMVTQISSKSRHGRLILRSTDPENQTVVDDQGETDPSEETETKEEEAPKKDVHENGYSGPGAEILKKLKQSDSKEAADLVGELEKELQKMVQEKKEAEKRSNDVEAELEEAKSKYLRLNADFDNFRKRANTEKEQLRTTTKGDVIETLLPLIDNFERARSQIQPQNESEEAIVTSFMGMYRQMVDLFNELGVEAIDCEKKPFDPEFHDAIMREPNDDLPDGTVIEELRKGFTINGRLLRPAMVKVSFSDEVLQDTELPMEEETLRIDTENEASQNVEIESSENASE